MAKRDVTIYNPDLDQDGADAARIVRYLADVLGVEHMRDTGGPGLGI